MRVLIVHNNYGKPSGEEHALSTFERLLRENGHEVLQFRKSSESLMGGSRIEQIKAFASGIHSFKSAKEIDAFLGENEVDVVQLQNVFPFLSPSVVPVIKRHGIPVVMRCPNYRLFCPSGLHLRDGKVCTKCAGGKEWNCFKHNCESNRLKSLGYSIRSGWARYRRTFLDHVDQFLVLTEFQKKRFMDGGIEEERISLMPNFSQQPIDKPLQRSLGKTVSFVGRLSQEKGIELFLQAAERLPHLKFVAAGNDRWISDTGRSVPPNVELTGFLSGSELEQFYRDSKMMCFPCQWFEGFPNVMITAMEHSKPIVAADIGALPEIINRDECGILHEPSSLDEMVAAIEKLSSDDELCDRLGQNGLRRVQQHYHESVVYPRLIEIYERSIQRQSSKTRI